MNDVVSLANKQAVWTPQPRQAIALSCPADELMYGGAKGGGKSDFLLACASEQIALADRKWRQTYRPQRGRAILFRKNLKNLDDLVQRSKELFPLIDPEMMSKPDRGFFKLEKRWVFSSGYRFDFAHLDGPDDHRGYHGQEITALLFDQVEEISDEVYQFLCAQVRSTDPDMRKLLMVRCTANPGGKYAQWVKDYFVSPCPQGNKIISQELQLSRGRSRTVTKCFIPAKLSDNRYLDSDTAYEAQLRKLPLHTQRMYLDGDWDVVIGSHFASIWDRSKHLIPAFSIPPSWEIKFGMDWGSTSPACVIVGARSNDGDVYLIDEIYGPGLAGGKFAARFRSMLDKQRWSKERKWVIDELYGLVDPGSDRRDNQEGPSAFTSMRMQGMRLFKSFRGRDAGMEQILTRLVGDRDRPRLFIMEGRCPNLVRTLPNLRTDPKNQDDIDTEDEDHAYDALRYLLMDWPLGPEKEEPKGDKDVERWLEILKGRERDREETTTGYS